MSTVDKVLRELKVTKFNLTDTGNSKLIAHLFGDKVRFDHRLNRWLIWNGHIWKPDINGETQRLAKQTAEERYKYALSINDTELKKNTSKWALRSEDNQKINAAISLLKSEHPVADSGDNWDNNPMLLGVLNGIVDLKTGVLRNGKQEDRITMVAGVNFNPEATCPRWEQFLQEVFEGDRELIHYIHKSLGYSLTGNMDEQVAFFCYGSGSNGKSVMFQTIREIVGDYGHDAPSSLLEKNRYSTSTNDEREIEHKRFIVYSETLTSSRLNEQRLKKITGGDAITARQLYEKNATFKPTAKIWMFLNHKPSVSDDSYAFWRRVRLIPFNRTFKAEEREKRLDEKLLSESEGILAWLVRGCRLWQEEGLEPTPAKVLEGTKVYRQENDVLVEFFYDLVSKREGAEVRSTELFKEYLTWAENEKIPQREVLGSKTFSQKLKEKFGEPKPRKDGNYYLIQSDVLELISGGTSNTPLEANMEHQESFFQKSPYEKNIKEVTENGASSSTQPQNSNSNFHHQEKNSADEFIEEVKEGDL